MIKPRFKAPTPEELEELGRFADLRECEAVKLPKAVCDYLRRSASACGVDVSWLLGWRIYMAARQAHKVSSASRIKDLPRIVRVVNARKGAENRRKRAAETGREDMAAPRGDQAGIKQTEN